MADKCLFCNNELKLPPYAEGFIYTITCPICGIYKCNHQFSMCFKVDIFDKRQQANMKGWIKENQGFLLTGNSIDELANLGTPNVNERVAKLMGYLGNKYPTLGGKIPNSSEDPVEWQSWISVSYSLNEAELKFLLWRYLRDVKKFIYDGDYVITPLGNIPVLVEI